jgi:hypothetical protein
MCLGVLYDPGVMREKIRLIFETGKGLTVSTERPMPFPDTVKMDYVSYGGFLYERQIEESAKTAEIMGKLRAADFSVIMNSREPFHARGYSKAVISKDDFGSSFEIILSNPEKSANPEITRIHNLLKKLFNHIGMDEWYDYGAWGNKK